MHYVSIRSQIDVHVVLLVAIRFCNYRVPISMFAIDFVSHHQWSDSAVTSYRIGDRSRLSLYVCLEYWRYVLGVELSCFVCVIYYFSHC